MENNSAETRLLIAGFGGQGVLFAGKFIAYAGLLMGKHVTHLPSYGPEMRGGTANCGVVLSDNEIGSPIVTSPDILIVMNKPSFDKYIGLCCETTQIFIDSFLIHDKTDTGYAHYIKATQLADDYGLLGLANMILIGLVLKETGLVPKDIIKPAMEKCVPKDKAPLIEANIRAIGIGGG